VHALPSRAPLLSQDVAAVLWFVFNVTRTPFKSHKCRHAFSLAIDRTKILEKVLGNTEKLACSIVTDSLSRLKREPLPYDPEKARELLAKGLFEQGVELADLPPLRLRIYNHQRHRLIAEELKRMWKDVLGISIHIEIVSWETFFDEISKRNYDMTALSWYSWYKDALYTLDNFRYASNDMNISCWEDSYLQEVLAEAEKTSTLEKREELLKTAEAFIMHRLPVMPICGHTFRYMKDPHIDRICISHLGNIDLKWTTFT